MCAGFFCGGLRPNLHNKPIITMTGSSSDLSLTMLLCKMAIQTTNWYQACGSVMISCRNVGPVCICFVMKIKARLLKRYLCGGMLFVADNIAPQ